MINMVIEVWEISKSERLLWLSVCLIEKNRRLEKLQTSIENLDTYFFYLFISRSPSIQRTVYIQQMDSRRKHLFSFSSNLLSINWSMGIPFKWKTNPNRIAILFTKLMLFNEMSCFFSLVNKCQLFYWIISNRSICHIFEGYFQKTLGSFFASLQCIWTTRWGFLFFKELIRKVFGESCDHLGMLDNNLRMNRPKCSRRISSN